MSSYPSRVQKPPECQKVQEQDAVYAGKSSDDGIRNKCIIKMLNDVEMEVPKIRETRIVYMPQDRG